jgi:hypothetical protein
MTTKLLNELDEKSRLLLDMGYLQQALSFLKEISDMKELFNNSHEECIEKLLTLPPQQYINLIVLATKCLNVRTKLLGQEFDEQC